MKLVIISGYAGSGKSTLSFRYAKKHDYALIIQDHFLFKMNPSNLKTRKPTAFDHEIAIKNILSCIKNYMVAGKEILIEGALVSISDNNPVDIAKFIDLSKKYNYEVIWIMLVANEKIRIRRQKKRGNTLLKHIDNKLVKAANELNDKFENYKLDTSKLTIKKSLEEIEKIIDN